MTAPPPGGQGDAQGAGAVPVTGPSARFVPSWELREVSGTVVVVDVLRAFTTAAYAFAGGATEIWLVSGVQEAVELGASIPGAWVMGEDRGRRVAGFDLSNSPAEIVAADVDGRVLVQRTSAGTQGVVAAVRAERLLAASLVCAAATARSVGVTTPTYVISGRSPDAPGAGDDDLLTAGHIEDLRLGRAPDPVVVADELRRTREAQRLLAADGDHGHPDDVTLAADVDRFDFAMEVTRVNGRHRLRALGVDTPTRRVSSATQ